MKKLLLICFLLFSFNAKSANNDGTVWEGIGLVPSTLQVLNGGTVRVIEKGNQAVHQTVLTFTATPVTMAGSAGNVLYGGLQVYTFQKGNIQLIGAEIQSAGTVKLTCSSAGSATFTGLSSLGTVTAANDATLTSTEANILASTVIAAATAKVATVKNIDLVAPPAPLDGTTTAIPVFLNFIVDTDAANAAGTCTFTGTVTLAWTNLTYN